LTADTNTGGGPTPARITRSLIIVFIIAIVFGIVSKVGMETLNRKMGIEGTSTGSQPDSAAASLNATMPETTEYIPAEAVETASSVWVPDWKQTPCSLFVSEGSSPELDSLPQASDPGERATELQLLVELWASHAGFSQLDIESVWAFSSGDTCFIDLPSSAWWPGVVGTIEGRFISYTLMFPFVAGEIVEGYENGIPLRGIPSNR